MIDFTLLVLSLIAVIIAVRARRDQRPSPPMITGAKRTGPDSFEITWIPQVIKIHTEAL